MILNPTVLIVGAGASADFGLPVGPHLISNVLAQLGSPNIPLLRGLHLAGHDEKATSRFRERLMGSASDSIDTFLERGDQATVSIGKAAIAHVILQSEARCVAEGRLFENPPGDNWLKYVWNAIRARADAADLTQNEVTFVTFNYDRVLETYFETAIRNSFDLSPKAAKELRENALPIVHLHGQVPEAVDFGYANEALLVGGLPTLASGIRVVHDEVPAGDEAFGQAHRLLAMAKLVVFLGFGYHQINLTRLRIAQVVAGGASLVGSVFGMRTAEINLAKTHVGRDFTHASNTLHCEAFLRECAALV